MARSDGSVVIDTKLNTGGFSKGAGSLKSQFSGLAATATKLTGALAAAFSVRAIVSFSKEALELGSNLQEVQNVVDVTFSTMSGMVDQFAKAAAKTAGLSETMAKKYAGTFGAMAKSFNFTEAEAYDMATSLTQLSGDVASFYNLSQDEAYTKLKSVFTGETESLKDLGVVMSQTALDDYALRKGLKKTTSQMTEQEKVALRYEFVLDQLSGASGDFIRTQDGWANQTRVLSLQFEQLKATLGQGLINALTPALKLLNELIGKVQQFAEIFKEVTEAIFGDAGGSSGTGAALAEGYDAAAKSAEAMAVATEEAGKAVKKYLAGFDEITQIGATDSTPGTEMGSGANGSGTPNAGTAEVSKNAGIVAKILETIAKIRKEVDRLFVPAKDINYKKGLESLKKLGETFDDLGKSLSDDLEWGWFNIMLPLQEWTVEEYTPATIEALADAFDMLSEALDPTLAGLESFFEYAKPMFDWIGDSAIEILGDFGDQFEKLGAVFKEKSPEIEKIWENLGVAFSGLWEIAEPILDHLKEKTTNALDAIGDLAAEVSKYVIDGLLGITEFLAGAFTADWKRALNGLIDAANKMISGLVNGINDLLKGFKGEIPDWVPVFGGQSFSFGGSAITAPQIPRLAKGGVLPANKPFLAMLGDQRHGTNIEAPLSTIQEAVAAVMADYEATNLAGHEATVEVLQQLLAAVLGIEVGDTTIGQAANRYNRRMAVTNGGV